MSYRKDGRYMGRITFQKKLYCVYAQTKDDCIKKLKQKYEELVKKDDIRKKDVRWKEWIDYWWVNYKTQEIKESSIKIYEPYKTLIAENERIKDKFIGDINELDLLNFINNLPTDKQKRTCHMLLRDICSKALRNGLIKYDLSCFIIKTNNEHTSKAMILETEQIKTCSNYLQNYNKDIYYWFIFTLNTGVRIGESLALTWDDIDFSNKTININKSYNQTLKKVTFPKSKNGFRVIPLFTQVERLLLMLDNNKPLLFNITIHQIKIAFENIYKLYGIKIHPHMLRHTFATSCLNHNVNSMVVQEWLGHASVKTTQDIYQHINSLNSADTNKMDFDTFY